MYVCVRIRTYPYVSVRICTYTYVSVRICTNPVYNRCQWSEHPVLKTLCAHLENSILYTTYVQHTYTIRTTFVQDSYGIRTSFVHANRKHVCVRVRITYECVRMLYECCTNVVRMCTNVYEFKRWYAHIKPVGKYVHIRTHSYNIRTHSY